MTNNEIQLLIHEKSNEAIQSFTTIHLVDSVSSLVKEHNAKTGKKGQVNIKNIPNELRDLFPLQMATSEDGKTFSFVFKDHVAPHSFTVSFSPQLFLEDYIKTKWEKYVEKGNVSPELFRNFIEQDISGLMRVLVFNFFWEMVEAKNLQWELALKIRDVLISDDFLKNKDTSKEHKEIDKMIEFANIRRRKRILAFNTAQFESITAAKYLFCKVFEERNKIWKKAKKFYTANKGFSKWREMLEIEFAESFSEFGFPRDLIDRLSLQGESAPKQIALEETQMILEIPSKKVRARTLDAYLMESRKEAQTVSPERIAQQLERFIQYKKRRESQRAEMKELF